MAIRGYITNEGLNNAIQAADNQGWYIVPKKFALSSYKGILEAKRTMLDMEVIWYENWISGRIIRAPDSITFLCMVPPQQAQVFTDVNEIYVIGEDVNGEDFLLYVAQPDEQIVYDPSGTLRIRITASLTNVNLSATYQFVYTQAQEIESHDADPNAHPDIMNRFIKMGYPINEIDRIFKGQLLDEIPSYSTPVIDSKLVYYDIVDGEYKLALADGTEKDRVIGLILINEYYSQVVSGGYIQTSFNEAPYSFPDYGIIYLSSSIAGEPTINRTTTPVGVHLKQGVCYFPPAAGLAKYAGIGGAGLGGTPYYVNSDTIAKANDNLLVDLTNNPITISLPTDARLGDSIVITDVKYMASINNITVNGQGALINGTSEDLIIDVDKAVIHFLYESEGNNWILDFGGSKFSGYTE